MIDTFVTPPESSRPSKPEIHVSDAAARLSEPAGSLRVLGSPVSSGNLEAPTQLEVGVPRHDGGHSKIECAA